MLIIAMKYNQKENRNKRREILSEVTILHGEVNEIIDETLREINDEVEEVLMENVATNLHELVSCHYEEYQPVIINCDKQNHPETFDEVNFNLILPSRQISDSAKYVIDEMDENCDTDENDEYEYYYEEVTDDDDSDEH